MDLLREEQENPQHVICSRGGLTRMKCIAISFQKLFDNDGNSVSHDYSIHGTTSTNSSITASTSIMNKSCAHDLGNQPRPPSTRTMGKQAPSPAVEWKKSSRELWNEEHREKTSSIVGRELEM
ncbi:hypothetical protein NL676_029614 [Syzygium grande]|nr:hypothetical protein NL676_029614 [Syzygium grande]